MLGAIENRSFTMHRRNFLATAATLLAAPRAFAAAATIEVYKSATCGCCNEWVKHLRAAGFTVRTNDVAEPGEYRRRFGIPDALGGCHTARVGPYALEGHVPAREIQRLLRERPAAVGLSVPGMPVGSPGMEYENRLDPYQVLLVQRDGSTTVYARYGA
jgi:hypothetical protein